MIQQYYFDIWLPTTLWDLWEAAAVSFLKLYSLWKYMIISNNYTKIHDNQLQLLKKHIYPHFILRANLETGKPCVIISTLWTRNSEFMFIVVVLLWQQNGSWLRCSGDHLNEGLLCPCTGHTVHSTCHFAQLKERLHHCSDKKLEDDQKFLKSDHKFSNYYWHGARQAHMCWELCWLSFRGSFAICDTRQAVAVDVIKAVNQKAVGAGKVTKSTQKAQKAKLILSLIPCTPNVIGGRIVSNYSSQTLLKSNGKRVINDNHAS